MQFVKQCVFTCSYDTYIKQAIRTSMDPKEVIANVQHMKDALEEVMAAFKKERGPQAPEKKPEIEEAKHMEEPEFHVPLSQLVTAEQKEKDSENELPRWQEFLEETFDKWTKFILNDASSTTLAEELKGLSVVTECAGLDKGHAVLVFDCKTAGESSSHPQTRQPPFRPKDLTKWVHAFIRAMDPTGKFEGNLPAKHLVCVFDGGKAGNDHQIHSSFTDPSEGKLLSKECQRFMVVNTQKSLGERKERVRGFVQMTETLLVLSSDTLEIENKPRLYLEDTTTHASVLGFFPQPGYAHEDCWRVEPSCKKKILGKEGKILVGGAAVDPAPKPKFDDGTEPVSWHFAGKQVWEELVHSFDPKILIAATNLDHVLPLVCLEKQVPIVAACWTEDHRQALKLKVLKGLWAKFLDENSTLHQPGLCQAEFSA